MRHHCCHCLQVEWVWNHTLSEKNPEKNNNFLKIYDSNTHMSTKSTQLPPPISINLIYSFSRENHLIILQTACDSMAGSARLRQFSLLVLCSKGKCVFHIVCLVCEAAAEKQVSLLIIIWRQISLQNVINMRTFFPLM